MQQSIALFLLIIFFCNFFGPFWKQLIDKHGTLNKNKYSDCQASFIGVTDHKQTTRNGFINSHIAYKPQN